MQPWTAEELEKLRELHIDPQKNDPAKLSALIDHFLQHGSLWAVTRGKVDLRVSKGLARKVRSLVSEGKLAWVLKRSQRIASGRVQGHSLLPSDQSAPTFNIEGLKLTPSAGGFRVVKFGPPWIRIFPEMPPPAPMQYADLLIPTRVDNESGVNVTISDVTYRVTINGNYAGEGSAPGPYLIPQGNTLVNLPFRLDFQTADSVIISAIASKQARIEVNGAARYQSGPHSGDKRFSGIIRVTLDLPFAWIPGS